MNLEAKVCVDTKRWPLLCWKSLESCRFRHGIWSESVPLNLLPQKIAQDAPLHLEEFRRVVVWPPFLRRHPIWWNPTWEWNKGKNANVPGEWSIWLNSIQVFCLTYAVKHSHRVTQLKTETSFAFLCQVDAGNLGREWKSWADFTGEFI